jgi:hypothetical protein
VFERNEQEISQIIEENLGAVLSGKTSLNEVLQRYPQHETGLRQELEAALWLSSRRDEVKLRPGFLATSRKRVLDRIKEEASSRDGKHSVFAVGWPRQGLVFRWAAALVVVVLLLSGLGGAMAFAQGSLPGQELYPVKRAGETITYDLAVRNERRVELNIHFTGRRLQELETLVASGKMTYVEPTLLEYNREVNQAVSTLQEVSNSKTTEKLVLAEMLTEDLAKKADRLSGMTASVPKEFQDQFVDARDLTLNGAFTALDVSSEMNELIGTSTPTWTTIPTLTVTVTSTITSTAVPTNTVRPVMEEQSAKVTPTFTPEHGIRKATLTPRPTNPNRPSKDPKPPKDDKPSKDDKSTTNENRDK